MLDIEIGIESEVGKGTMFWLQIPIRRDAHALEEQSAVQIHTDSSQPVEEGSERASEYTILVIDDDELNLVLTTTILKNAGYIVHHTQSGREGIEIARTVQPDLILTDLAMPDMSGFEVAQALKGCQETADIPIIACTALATPDSHQKAIDVGCEIVLRRPIPPENLLKHVTQRLIHQELGIRN